MTNIRLNEMICCLLAMLILASCGAILSDSHMIAYADELVAVDNIDEMCRQYTDSIAPNGMDFNSYLSEFEAEQYPNHICILSSGIVPSVLHQNEIFGNNVKYYGSYSKVECDVDGDDNIVKLIPRELFTYANTTLFIGKKYGFLIVTNSSNSGIFTSTVIMIEVVGNVSDYLADITLNVRNALEFVYITTSQTSTILPNIDLSSSGIIATYTLNNGLTSAVVPMPGVKTVGTPIGNEKRLCYFESNRYTLANISFGAKISNQNNYNQWDSQYNASADTGYFFIGNNLSISHDDMRRLFVAGLRNDI